MIYPQGPFCSRQDGNTLALTIDTKAKSIFDQRH